jgi:hypothetical protein
MLENPRLRLQRNLLVIAAVGVASTGPARAQTVEFALDSLSVSESDVYAILPVTISQAPIDFASVQFQSVSGTADGGSDFTLSGGGLLWYAGDGDARLVYIDVLWDSDPEENETFTVELSSPQGEATLGSQTTVTVTIVDDDTGQVFLDVADAFDTATGKSYWLLADPQADVPVRLSTPAAAGGVAAGFASDLVPPGGTVSFAEGEDAGTIHLDFPGGNSVSDGTWIGDRGELDLVTAPPGMNVGLPGSLVMAWVRPVGGRASQCDVEFCAFVCWVFDPDLSGECYRHHGSISRSPSLLGTLRRYRDEILASTSVGQYYIDLHDSTSTAVIEAIFASPSLAIRTLRAVSPWVFVIEDLVDGNGDSAVVTPAMQSDLLTLLDAYATFGDPALASTIASERTKLQLDSIAGLTMTEFQDRIESLGGPQSVEPSSWSRVKATYR